MLSVAPAAADRSIRGHSPPPCDGDSTTIIHLNHQQVMERYQLHSCRQWPVIIHGFDAMDLYVWEGWRPSSHDGYGPHHVFICAICPMRGPDDVKGRYSKGYQGEKVSGPDVCHTTLDSCCLLAS